MSRTLSSNKPNDKLSRFYEHDGEMSKTGWRSSDDSSLEHKSRKYTAGSRSKKYEGSLTADLSVIKGRLDVVSARNVVN